MRHDNPENNMMQGSPIPGLTVRPLLPVRTVDDLELLVKEFEIATGRAGRAFLVADDVGAAWKVAADLAGFRIVPLRGAADPASSLVTPAELGTHPLGTAIRRGQLFAEPLH